MNIFPFKKRFFILLFCFFLASVALAWLKSKSPWDPLFVFNEIQNYGVNFQKGMADLIKKYVFLLKLEEKNKQLELENQTLKTRLQLFDETLKENNRLKKLLKFPLNQDWELVSAQITGLDFLSKSELLHINKGSQQGLKKFMAVLHPLGFVGYVFRVSPHSAQVITLLNPLSSLPARSTNHRISGLISAGPKGLLSFDYLDQEFKNLGESLEKELLKELNEKNLKKSSKNKSPALLTVGESLVTTKSRQFPAGFPIGYISAIDYPTKTLNLKVYVTPAVEFLSLEEVLVVLNPKTSLLKNPSLKQNKSPDSNKKESQNGNLKNQLLK